MSVSIGELAVRFGCELRGDPDTRVERVATLASADQRSLAFLANPRYRSQLAATRAAAVVMSARDATGTPAALLLCANPYATYARIAALLHPPRGLRSPRTRGSSRASPSDRACRSVRAACCNLAW